MNQAVLPIGTSDMLRQSAAKASPGLGLWEAYGRLMAFG